MKMYFAVEKKHALSKTSSGFAYISNVYYEVICIAPTENGAQNGALSEGRCTRGILAIDVDDGCIEWVKEDTRLARESQNDRAEELEEKAKNLKSEASQLFAAQEDLSR